MVLRSLLVGVLALGSFVFIAPKAEAMSLNPPIFEFVMNPGDRIEDIIKVFNDSTAPLMLKPEIVNFTAKADDEITGVPEFYPLDETRTGRELAPWIDVADVETSLEPLTRKDIHFTITAPEDASPGSYFGGVILRTGQQAERGVGLVTGTAVLMLVKIGGAVVEDATLTDFDVSGGMLTHLPAFFEARVLNEGTVHLQPTGEITIRNIFGKTVGIALVNPELRSVLPDSARRYEASWGQEPTVVGQALSDGTSEFMRQWKGFAFGRYEADVTLAYGSSDKTLHAMAGFWVIPWMVIGTVILCLLVLFLVIKTYFRWFAKRVIARYEKTTR